MTDDGDTTSAVRELLEAALAVVSLGDAASLADAAVVYGEEFNTPAPVIAFLAGFGFCLARVGGDVYDVIKETGEDVMLPPPWAKAMLARLNMTAVLRQPERDPRMMS